MNIVGHCPHCGAPLYGDFVASGPFSAPRVKYSCDCRVRQGTYPAFEPNPNVKPLAFEPFQRG